MGGSMRHLHILLPFRRHSFVWGCIFFVCWSVIAFDVASARRLASEDTNYALHKKHEAMNGKIIYKNPRNAPSDSCPRDEESIKRTGRKCLRKCSSDADCLSRRKICICDGICGLSCIKPDRECGDLDNPVFGFVEFNGKLVGSQAKYKCQEGYHLIGQEYRRCQADGTWSSMPPECRENLYCTDPPLIPNAKHNGTTGVTRFAVNMTLEYTCDQGYSTVGFNDAKCFLYNNTMQWFGPEMNCEPKSCGDPGEIPNGHKETECYSYSCRLSYSCRPGFTLEGRNTLYCQHDGSWNPKDLPKCKPIQCDLPDNPDHGKAHYTSVYYNAVVNYECNYSYMIVGPTTRTCGPDMKWTGEQPQCVVMIAPAGCIVPTIENGRLSNDTRSGTQVPHGSTITVTCEDHYEQSQNLPPSTCYNSTWTHYPHCHPARCKRLPERPRHGMVIAPKTAHGMKARYRCKDGYRLQGSSTTICHFGNWTGHTPRCKIVYCPFPGYLTNGRVLLVGNMGMYDYRPYVKKVRNNRQIRYECNRGFYLSEGPPGATCIAGRWSPKHLPKCDPKLHPRVQWLKRSVSIADYLKYLNQTKNEELQLNMTTTPASPEEDLLWPITARDDTGEDEIINGEIGGAFNENSEKPGEYFEENSDRFADSLEGNSDKTGDYFYGNSEKAIKYFEGNSEKAGDNFEGNSEKVGGSLGGNSEKASDHFEENSEKMGDYVEGNSKNPGNYLKGNSENSYDSPENNFEKRNDNNGLIIHEKGATAENTNMSKATYSYTVPIKDGYVDNMVGDTHHNIEVFEPLRRVPRSATTDTREKTHRKRNEWKKLGKKASHCEDIDINEYVEVEVLRAGRDLNYTYSAGARIRVRCLEGHGLNIGNKTAKCSRGKWRPMKPECVTLPCLVPQTANGYYEFNSVQVPQKATIPHAEVVRFWCQDGYAVLGSNTLRCWYGDWTVTGIRPHCQPDPCSLPAIEHGEYLDGHLPGDSMEHGTVFSYACEDGWLVNVPQITCHLGNFLPEQPSCVTPEQATHIGHRLPQPMKLLSFSESDVSLGGDITSIDFMAGRHSSCSPPTQIQGTVIFKNGQPLDEEERRTHQSTSYQDPLISVAVLSSSRRFPDGSEVTFNCIANTMGEKSTWKLRCEDGSWVGQKTPSFCRSEEPKTEAPDEVMEGNKSCIWKKSESRVVTFHGDLELTELVMEFPPGTELVSRCSDIGKYAFVGSVRRRCVDGEWTGESPKCFGLNRDFSYSLDRPPTILIRHKDGPIAQTNDGQLLVYPGTQLYLECLWVRRYGTPRWNVSHTFEDVEDEDEKDIGMELKEKLRSAGLTEEGGGKYWTGWSTDAMRNPQLEYRLALYTTHVGDSGNYTCTTPTGHSHSIYLDIRKVECPPLEESFQGPLTPRRHPQSTTTMNTIVNFSCGPGLNLIGPRKTKCLPSGKWSSSMPRCESRSKRIRCDLPEAPKNGRLSSKGPFTAADDLEITCDTGYMLTGQPVMLCKPDGTWSAPVPTCTQACMYPGIIISGTMSSVKFYYPVNDNVTYACSSEFELHGEATITCLEGGIWSAPVPSCLPKP
ncbi:sushi, von Willebrand factor type A, EGF and pentraxin domain-containing protein 1-like isoform X1 [Palaemon carinicauda]|uniref:sushi, von Willebrand factor type A, EGF and pentraxin domain-containing protein 1-like isoform X1 n=1 Tax=Palaemon carinicauda TaxID=392227 RepID=UPI0035B60AC2